MGNKTFSITSAINMETPNATTFTEEDYDVSLNVLCWIALCPCVFGALPYSTTLHLGTEEVTKTDVGICGRSESKRPYGELGGVERSNCLCCVNFRSSFGEISPGCGCNAELVDEIVGELKARQLGRGDTAQIKRVEQTLERLDEIEGKLDKIMDHLQIERP
mmetsp:Transcript_7421/g.12354  ORF Transcript_7421/g.12354 Transcript_7421/m.12354 type:complete len:162 (-) Transcript_7421:156-641(-)